MLIDFCFKGVQKQAIKIRKYGLRWVNIEKEGSILSVKTLKNDCFVQRAKNIQTYYWDSCGIRSSTVFCKSFFFTIMRAN